MAAAIILIPEMLSGPKRTSEAPPAQSDVSLKTYTIDLNRSPGTPAAAELEERAPPPEIAEPTPSSEQPIATERAASFDNQPAGTRVLPESESAPSPSTAERVAREEATPNAQSSAQSPPPQPPPAAVRERPSPASAQPIASTASVPTSRGWAVQLGSFANRVTADRLVNDLSGSGHNAFVMPVKSGTATLYRVRIGPFADRAAANDALRGVKGRVANAAVVAHP